MQKGISGFEYALVNDSAFTFKCVGCKQKLRKRVSRGPGKKTWKQISETLASFV